MSIIRAPKGKRFIVSTVNSQVEFGTIIDEEGINIDLSLGGSIKTLEVPEGQALLKFVLGEKLEFFSLKFVSSLEGEKTLTWKEGEFPDEACFICPVGSKYSWESRTSQGYVMDVYEGEGEIYEESSLLILVPSVIKYSLSVSLDDTIESSSIKIGEETFSVPYKGLVPLESEVSIECSPKEGFRSLPFKNNFKMTSNVKIKIKGEKVLPRVPVRLEVEGEWSNPQYVINGIDTEGLEFWVVYSDETRDPAEVVPSDKKWEFVGQGKMDFSWTGEGVTLTCSKEVEVLPREVQDKYGNVWLLDEKYLVCGTQGKFGPKAEIPWEANGMRPFGAEGTRGMKFLATSIFSSVIPEGAFKDCKDLEEVKFRGDKPLNLGSRAFEGCSGLKTVDFLSLGEDNILSSNFGNGSRDVWSGCDKLSVIKVPKGVFSSSLGEINIDNDKSSGEVFFCGPKVKYDLNLKGKFPREKGFVRGSLFSWQMDVLGSSGDFKKFFLYERVPSSEGETFKGNLSLGNKGSHLLGSRDFIKVPKWSLEDTGVIKSSVDLGEGNSCSLTLEVLGLGSGDFDYDEVSEGGYEFGAFGTPVGVISPEEGSSPRVLKVSDVLYTDRVEGKDYRYLDLLKPLVKKV